MGEWPRSLARRRLDAETAVKETGRDWFAFIICRLEDDAPIGRADVFEVDRLNGSAGFGMAIGEHRWRGQGLGSDTVNTIIDFCFGQLRLERVWLATDSVNERAQRMYLKAGLIEEGRLRRAFYQHGSSRTTSGWRSCGRTGRHSTASGAGSSPGASRQAAARSRLE